ncbi:MAG: flagellar biosynthetic protein FliR [Novosphingobium sp.]|nr:flagellar biosynthetic protein FliR [Novosphingobium sp.]
MNFPDFGLGPLAGQLWMVMFLSVRAGAAMLAAPLFGGVAVPVQLRALLGVALGVFVMNWVPLPALPAMLSFAGFLALLEEAVIGLALGFVLQLSFAVPMIAAEQVSGTMGMAIATAVDPGTGAQSGAIGQFFSLLLTLTFLALGAHLLWFELLVESYRLLPAGGGALPAAAGMRMVEFAGAAFTTAAAIALPMVLVLLLVQLATGVLSRSAPSLNLFALGLPAGVLAGLAALIAALPVLSAQFATLAEDAVLQAAALIRP